MLYLQNIREAQVLFIPNNGERVEGELILRLKNTMELKTREFEALEAVYASYLYHTLSVTLPEGTEDGEYEYVLEDDYGILSQGVLRIGSRKAEMEYNKTIEYEQYESGK